MKRFHSWFALAICAALLPGCSTAPRPGGGALPSLAAAAGKSFLGVQFSYVHPSRYTNGINPIYDAENVLAVPHGTTASKHRLFLWLGGTKTIPKMYRYIMAVAALNGFNVIGLEYPNIPEINALCATSHDPNCWGGVRFKILTGANTSTLVKVDRTNSIEQRLSDLLGYLAKRYPAQNW